MRERVAFFLCIGEHERECQLAEHGDEQVGVVVVETIERGAQQRGPLGVGEVDRDTATATADEREGCLRGRPATPAGTRQREGLAERGPAFERVTQAALRASEAHERVAARVDIGRELGGER